METLLLQHKDQVQISKTSGNRSTVTFLNDSQSRRASSSDGLEDPVRRIIGHAILEDDLRNTAMRTARNDE